MVRQIAGYEIIGEVGQGAMATVYRARAIDADNAAAEEVAIKLLRPEYQTDLGFRARFEREGELIKGLEHEAIAPVYDFGQVEGRLYIVMAYMPHGTLSQRLLHKQLTFDEVLAILARVGAALDYAHSQGVIHRDLKPSNVLFDAHDEAFLADFGIAQVKQHGDAGAETISGTPAYMSPEQARREKTIGAASDIYALGIVAFQLLTGQIPFGAESPVAVLVQQMQEPPPPPSSVNAALPEVVDPVFERALAKKAANRYASAGAFIGALRQALTGEDTGVAVAVEVGQDVTPSGKAEGELDLVDGSGQRSPKEPEAPLSFAKARQKISGMTGRMVAGARMLRRRLRDRPQLAFVLITILAVVSACIVAGVLRGADVVSALRGEAPAGLQVRGATPTAVVYLPFTGAGIEVTSAMPAATAAPTVAMDMRMLVSQDVVTLLNISGVPLSLSGVRVQRVSSDGDTRATFGLDGLRRVAGNAIDALPPGECLQVWRTEAVVGRGPEKPEACDTLRGWLATRQTNPLFQGLQEGERFELLQGEERLVSCTLAEESCDFFLAQE